MHIRFFQMFNNLEIYIYWET